MYELTISSKLFVTTRNTLASAVCWQFQLNTNGRSLTQKQGAVSASHSRFELAEEYQLPKNCMADSFVWGCCGDLYDIGLSRDRQ